MQPLLTVSMSEMSVSERIQLAEDLWDSIVATSGALPITELQKQELDRRLEAHRQSPDSGSSWGAVKERLGESL